MDTGGHNPTVRENVTRGQERRVGSCFRLVAQAKRYVCSCRKSNPGRPFNNHSLHRLLYICFWCKWCIQKLLNTRRGLQLNLSVAEDWFLTSSRLWIEKWAWKIKYAYLFLRSGKLLASFLIHKRRHEVKKGFDEVFAKPAEHHDMCKMSGAQHLWKLFKLIFLSKPHYL